MPKLHLPPASEGRCCRASRECPKRGPLLQGLQGVAAAAGPPVEAERREWPLLQGFQWRRNGRGRPRGASSRMAVFQASTDPMEDFRLNPEWLRGTLDRTLGCRAGRMSRSTLNLVQCKILVRHKTAQQTVKDQAVLQVFPSEVSRRKEFVPQTD